MKTISSVESGIDELLSILDKDVAHMRQNLARLDKLRGLVVKRDEQGLAGMLQQIKAEFQEYDEHVTKRRAVREKLARALDWQLGQVTLTRLEQIAGQEKKPRIAQLKSLLESLTAELKTQYMGTASLLSDCARFNNMLLRTILELGGAKTVTYCPKGSVERKVETGFVSATF